MLVGSDLGEREGSASDMVMMEGGNYATAERSAGRIRNQYRIAGT